MRPILYRTTHRTTERFRAQCAAGFWSLASRCRVSAAISPHRQDRASFPRRVFQHLQPPKLRQSHQHPNQSAVWLLDADVSQQPGWRRWCGLQPALSDRRPPIDPTGAQASILSSEPRLLGNRPPQCPCRRIRRSGLLVSITAGDAKPKVTTTRHSPLRRNCPASRSAPAHPPPHRECIRCFAAIAASICRRSVGLGRGYRSPVRQRGQAIGKTFSR